MRCDIGLARWDVVKSPFRYRRMVAVAIAAAAIAVLTARPALGDGWIPPAGTGVVEPMLRFSFGDTSFPANSFSTATSPSSSEQETQIRIVGEQGLGDGWSVDYDLRYGFLRHWKVKNGVTLVESNSGLQDQRVGLNYGLTQGQDFADAIGFGVVAPGSPGTGAPALDSGQWAVEPIYRVGFKPGFWGLTASADVEPRIFLDGGATQFRTHLEIGAPIFHDVIIAGKLFFVRSAQMSGYNSLRDRGELYNLLRLGVEAKFRLTDTIEPVIAYEDGIAGMGGHAAQRFTVGLQIRY